MRAAIVLVFLSACAGPLHAGEWMFRLKDAHVQLRRALFDGNADAAWEHVDRSTRQQAGLLAGRIRAAYDGLPEDNKRTLAGRLGIEDGARIRSIRGQDLLVARFFLEAHPYLLTGSRDDAKLKDHATRMAGPTAIVINAKAPDQKVVPYVFTVEGHFGGQAMDYRAQLTVPSLDDILGPAPRPATLSAEEAAVQAVAVFRQAQKAFAEGDVDALWPLLDCESQSQADHFADQAQEMARRRADVAGRLGITAEELARLDGKRVWALAWAREDLAAFAEATDPKYRDAGGFAADRLMRPTGFKPRGKSPSEPVVEFESQGRSLQIPARLNHRNGVPEIKLVLRPPFYLRLRGDKAAK